MNTKSVIFVGSKKFTMENMTSGRIRLTEAIKGFKVVLEFSMLDFRKRGIIVRSREKKLSNCTMVDVISKLLSLKQHPEVNVVNDFELILLMANEEETFRLLLLDNFQIEEWFIEVSRWAPGESLVEPKWLLIKDMKLLVSGFPEHLWSDINFQKLCKGFGNLIIPESWESYSEHLIITVYNYNIAKIHLVMALRDDNVCFPSQMVPLSIDGSSFEASITSNTKLVVAGEDRNPASWAIVAACLPLMRRLQWPNASKVTISSKKPSSSKYDLSGQTIAVEDTYSLRENLPLGSNIIYRLTQKGEPSPTNGPYKGEQLVENWELISDTSEDGDSEECDSVAEGCRIDELTAHTR